MVKKSRFDPLQTSVLEASVEEGRRTIVVVNRVVDLGPGDHRVEFLYRPLSFTLGSILSSIGLLLCGLALLFRRGRRGS